MVKKLFLPTMAATILLAGCSAGDVDTLRSEVALLKQEVAELKQQVGGNPDSTPNTEAQSGNSNTGNNVYALGEPFEFEGVTYTVTKGERKPQLSENIEANEGNEYILMNLEIHNTSSADYHYSQSDYNIVTGAGEIVDNVLIIDTSDKYEDLGNGDLATGGKRSGWVAFEIPQGDQPLEFRYEVKTFSKASSFKVKLQ